MIALVIHNGSLRSQFNHQYMFNHRHGVKVEVKVNVSKNRVSRVLLAMKQYCSTKNSITFSHCYETFGLLKNDIFTITHLLKFNINRTIP